MIKFQNVENYIFIRRFLLQPLAKAEPKETYGENWCDASNGRGHALVETAKALSLNGLSRTVIRSGIQRQLALCWQRHCL